MTNEHLTEPWIKKAKWLTQAVIISGTLNVGFLGALLYIALRGEEQQTIPLHLNDPLEKPVDPIGKVAGMQELLSTYSTLPPSELFLRLDNADHVEAGYTRRDLSLACLVKFHHFNLEKALGGYPIQKREVFLNGQEDSSIYVFPSLRGEHYEAIIQYSKTEKWPLTAEGLFQELVLRSPPYDPSLLEAFYLTSEFHYIYTLFSKAGIKLKKEHIAALLSQGKWQTIEEMGKELRLTAEFNEDKRRRFLLEFVQEGSKLAARVLMQTDMEFCSKELKDEEVLRLCSMLGEKSPPAFVRLLLQAPRSDQIWKKAASILYAQAGENIAEEELNLHQAKRRFLEMKAFPKEGVKVEKKEAAPPSLPSKAGRVYKVVSGDSLWRIATHHKVTIDALREANKLKTDRLQVNQVLVIPN